MKSHENWSWGKQELRMPGEKLVISENREIKTQKRGRSTNRRKIGNWLSHLLELFLFMLASQHWTLHVTILSGFIALAQSRSRIKFDMLQWRKWWETGNLQFFQDQYFSLKSWVFESCLYRGDHSLTWQTFKRNR